MSAARLPSADPRRASTRHVERFVRFGGGTEWSPHHLLLAGVATLGVAVYLVALGQASSLDPLWWVLVLVPMVTWPLADSAAALILWTVLLLAWVNAMPEGTFSWWSLLAALGAALSHAATALSDSGPSTWQVPAAVARQWLRWLGTGLAAAAAVAVLAALLAGRAHGLSPAAYVIGLAGLAAAVWALRTNPPASGG